MACTGSLSACAQSPCCVPTPQGVTNMLGFAGGHPCCAYPCIEFPPYKVQICIVINSQTQVTIQRGCATPCLTDLEAPCNLVFGWGATQDSWGKRCRTVTFDEFVPAGTYIRIRLCGAEGCTDGCTTAGDGIYTDACGPANSLIKFAINGTDFVSTINNVAQGGGTTGCLIKAACIGNVSTNSDASTATCCQWYTTGPSTRVVSWANQSGTGTNDLPIGTEIVVGPIGTVATVAAVA